MPNDSRPSNVFGVPDLPTLVRATMREQNVTASELERRTGGTVSNQRWGQLSRGERLSSFPEPRTLEAIATGLQVDVTTVVLSAARHLGLDVHASSAGELVDRLPPGVEKLSPGITAGVVALIRALVEESAHEPSATITAIDDRRARPPAEKRAARRPKDGPEQPIS